MARSKQLTIQDITNEVSQYTKLKRITFEDGRYTEIYEKFDPDKVNELIDDFIDFVSEFEKRNGKIDQNNIYKYLYIHIVKHFSTICQDTSKNYEEKLLLFNNMLKSRYVLALEKEFDKNEITFIFDMLTKRVQDSIDAIKAEKTMRDELVHFIKNNKKLKNRDALAEVFLGEKIPQEGKKNNEKNVQKSK